MRSFSRVLLAACILLSTISGWAQEKGGSPELVIAAAADLSSALQEIGDSYEKKTGVKVKLSFGASGALTQQIQNGAPFDLFFSADMDYPRQLLPRAMPTRQVCISTLWGGLCCGFRPIRRSMLNTRA